MRQQVPVGRLSMEGSSGGGTWAMRACSAAAVRELGSSTHWTQQCHTPGLLLT